MRFALNFSFWDWSEREDLNLRHSAPKADALPGCATLRIFMLILYQIFYALCEKTAMGAI